MCPLLGEEKRKVLVDSGNSSAVFNKTVVKLLFPLSDIFRVTHTHTHITDLNQGAISHCREFLLFIVACASNSLQNVQGCVWIEMLAYYLLNCVQYILYIKYIHNLYLVS